jgi:hypothetical protein
MPCHACCVLCAVCCVLCAVCCVLCAVCCVLCAVCCVLQQGHSFVWEKDTVQISHQQRHVLFTGRWGANGERYRILMRPGSSSSIRRPPLQVGAQLVREDGEPPAAADAKGKVVCKQAGMSPMSRLAPTVGICSPEPCK